MSKFGDDFFNRLKERTNVDKDTILGLAGKLQQSNMKDEGVIRELIQDLSQMTGKEVSKEKEEKIIEAIVNDKVPKNLDQMI